MGLNRQYSNFALLDNIPISTTTLAPINAFSSKPIFVSKSKKYAANRIYFNERQRNFYIGSMIISGYYSLSLAGY